MTADKEAVIEAMRRAIPAIVLAALPRHLAVPTGRCLTTTRVGLETLRYFGIDSRPLVTQSVAANAAWVAWQASGAGGEMPDEAWSVASGFVPSEGPGLNAHVVLLVGDELLDLDAGAAARPPRGIHVAPTERLPWDPEHGASRDLEEGGVLVYLPHPHPPQFKHTPDWRDATALAGPVIRIVRAAVEGEEVEGEVHVHG